MPTGKLFGSVGVRNGRHNPSLVFAIYGKLVEVLEVAVQFQAKHPFVIPLFSQVRKPCRDLLTREPHPDIAFFAHFAEAAGIGKFPIQARIIRGLDGRAPGLLAHRETVHARLGQVHTVSVPHLTFPIHHSLVQEDVIGLSRSAQLLGLHAFALAAVTAVQADMQFPVRPETVFHGREDGNVLIVIGMPEVLAFGIIVRFEADLSTHRPPFRKAPGDPAVERIGLQGLGTGCKFNQIKRIQARMDKHGPHHILSFHLGEREVPRQGNGAFVNLGPGPDARFPERRGFKGRTETAVFHRPEQKGR